MGVCSFKDLYAHVGHAIEVTVYGRNFSHMLLSEIKEEDVVNVAIECLDCCMVLVDFDKEGEDD